MKSIIPKSELHKELNDEFIKAIKETNIPDNLIRLQTEVINGKHFTSSIDIRRYQEKVENLLAKINKEVDKITNVYNKRYARALGEDAFDINIYNKLQFRKQKDSFVLYYYDRLPKDAKMNLKDSAGMFAAICYKIQEYIDNKNLYPKPSFKKAHIVFETVYDKKSNKHIWDNDHISRFHIKDIINALVFIGIINSDEGLDTSFEVRSSQKKIPDSTIKKYNLNSKKNQCVAYTKITIKPAKYWPYILIFLKMPNIDLYFLRFYGGKIQLLLKFKRGKRGGVKFLAKIHLKMTPKSTIKIYLVYCLRPGAFYLG